MKTLSSLGLDAKRVWKSKRSPIDFLSEMIGIVRFQLIRLCKSGITGGPASLRARSIVRIDRRAKLHVGRQCRFMEDGTISVRGQLTIGDRCYFNRGFYISCYSSVSIGEGCIVGEYVSIHDENHRYDDQSVQFRDSGFVTKPIVIGRNVWLGTKVSVLPGVTIGDNVIVGANAVVTKDIPANSVAVGIPAQVVRSLW